MSDEPSSAARLIAVLDHLGIGRAHIATQIPGDIAELAALHPDHLAGIVLCAPFYLDPAPFILLADRLLMVSGEHGPGFDVTVRPGSRAARPRRL